MILLNNPKYDRSDHTYLHITTSVNHTENMSAMPPLPENDLVYYPKTEDGQTLIFSFELTHFPDFYSQQIS